MAAPKALLAAYRRTRYRIADGGRNLELRIGRLHPDLDVLLARARRRVWVYLTAVNPASLPLARGENRRRLAALRRRIVAAGFEPLAGVAVAVPQGSFPDEPSFLVLGASRRRGLAWARAFGQVAILAGRRGGPAELVIIASSTATPPEKKKPVPLAGNRRTLGRRRGGGTRRPLSGSKT